jgi:tryptophan-rich sensory protein
MEHTSPVRSLPPVAVAVLFVSGVGLIGGLLTQPGAWSAALVRPSWQPPPWVFGAVWGVVGISTTLALASGWRALARERDRKAFLTMIAVNGFFNVAWNALFFGLRRPDLAFIDIVALWLSIGAIILFFAGRGATQAARLMGPYLAWVTVAAALNLEIVQLNAPF